MIASLRTPRPAFLALAAALALAAGPDAARDVVPPPSPAFDPPAGALLADDFGAGRLGAWRADRAGTWVARRGLLRAELPDRRQERSFLYAGDSSWTDYAVDFDVCGMRGVDKGAVVRVAGARGLGVDLRGPGYHDLRLNLNELPLGRVTIENGNGVWHHVRFEVAGNHCRVCVNGRELIDRKMPRRLPSRGGIALAAYTGGVGECTVYYDNVVVTALPRP